LSLSDENRKELVRLILEDPTLPLRLHGEAPGLVSEAAKDRSLLRRLSRDPVLFSRLILGLEPTGYQEELLQLRDKRILVRWPRQSGKTRTLAIIAIWFSAFNTNATTLIVAPSRRQSMILSDLIHQHINRIPRKIQKALFAKRQRTTIYLRNGSRIVALPNSEHLLRGYHANLIIADEAAFFRNDESIFRHVLTPMLATTDGTLIVSSTPWGKNTLYYQYSNDQDWTQLHITWRQARDAGVYKPRFIKQIEKTRRTNPLTYRMEYEAEFTEEADTWLTQDLLAKAVDQNLEYTPFEKEAEGIYYLGVDLGERVDHSVIAALQLKKRHLHLVHMHRFPLGTGLASVIGYVKTLRDRWHRITAAYVDITKHGDYIIQDLHRAGVPEAHGITFTQNNKQEMAQILRRRLREATLHIPYDRHLLDELNVERYQLTKTGKIALDHPPGTHDDRFWATALAAYASEQNPPSTPPIAR